MTERYSLLQEPFSHALFAPHDFVIKDLQITKSDVTFVFEDDVTYHDGIKELFPGKKSLVLRFRLCGESLSVFRQKTLRFSWQKPRAVAYDVRKLPALCKQRLEYINHYVSYCSVLIELSSPVGELWLGAMADAVEYEWI